MAGLAPVSFYHEKPAALNAIVRQIGIMLSRIICACVAPDPSGSSYFILSIHVLLYEHERFRLSYRNAKNKGRSHARKNNHQGEIYRAAFTGHACIMHDRSGIGWRSQESFVAGKLCPVPTEPGSGSCYKFSSTHER